MNICEKFARIVARGEGLSYREARKLYPRACRGKAVYVNDIELGPEDHCVHCARIYAIEKYGAKGKPMEHWMEER